MATQIWATTGSAYGLLSDSTKLLPELMLTHHWCDLAAFTWGQCQRNCSRYFSLIWVWKLCVCIFQPLDKFLKSFQSQILDKYKDNKTTMSEVTTAFYKISSSGFLPKLNNFWTNVSQAFDIPLNNFITSTVTSMKTIYPKMLDKFIVAIHYFKRENFKILGISRHLWRIPVGIQPLNQT